MIFGTEKPPIDAVRAKIAEMRDRAEFLRRYVAEPIGVETVESKLLDDAANALEAVLDDAPCDAWVGAYYDCRCEARRDAHAGRLGHEFVFSERLADALTRAITNPIR